MTPEVPLVEIGGATIWRGSTRVFENLDLVIEQHERVAIVGPNGSGKTTLLRCLASSLRPDGGEVRWFGRPATSGLDCGESPAGAPVRSRPPRRLG